MQYNTDEEYKKVIEECRSLYINKLDDYGPAWRVLRTTSLTDQIYIKVQRIRTIQMKGKQEIEDDIHSEFIGILNYSIIAIIQLELGVADIIDINHQESVLLYDKVAKKAFELMQKKNHDYGEAWRDMRISSITDLILQKVLRIKQIEDNEGVTKVSEGLEANYLDMINYSAFALILIEEKRAAI